MSDASVDWKKAHDDLFRFAREHAARDFEEGVLLLAALRSGAHAQLAFGTFWEYIEQLFGYSPRLTAERVRVAEALEQLPEIASALRAGSVTWSAVRELTRVAVPETEKEWLAAAQGRTVRQVEALVSGHQAGDRPGERPSPQARRHVLRFEVTAEIYAQFRDAVEALRREAGGKLDEEEALLLMSRRVLGGPKDEGRASYQVAVTRCEDCGRGFFEGRGALVPVGSDMLEMASCDAQDIGDTHVGVPTKATQDTPPAIRRLVMRRDHGRCKVASCRSSVFVHVHHLHPRVEGGTHDPEGLAVLCSAHHRAVHRGLLIIEGSISAGLTFRHADGSPYPSIPSPKLAQTYSDAFLALRSLGYRETEARSAIEAVRPRVGPDVTPQQLVIAALGAIRTATASSATRSARLC